MRFQQSGDTLRRLSALADPVVDTLYVDAQIFLMVLSDRVEKSNALDVTAVTTVTAVGDNQVIKRTLFRASARKTNANHFNSVFVQLRGGHAQFRAEARADRALYLFGLKCEAKKRLKFLAFSASWKAD